MSTPNLRSYHDGCGQPLQRHLIAQHQEKCDKQPFSCDFCNDYNSTWYDVVANHFQLCECYPVSCPNYCTPYTIERQNLERHLNEDCPLQEVECEFKYTGCEIKLPRKDMPEHLKDSVSHMTLLVRQNQEPMTKLLEKDETIRRMTEEYGRETEENRQIVKQLERLVVDKQERLQQQDELIAKVAKKQRDAERFEQERNKQIEVLEQETRDQIERLKGEVRQSLRNTKDSHIALKSSIASQLEGHVMELKKMNEAAHKEVKDHTDRRVQEQLRKLAQERVETKRELSERVEGLAQQLNADKEELEERLEGLAQQQDATKIELEEQVEGLVQDIARREIEEQVQDLQLVLQQDAIKSEVREERVADLPQNGKELENRMGHLKRKQESVQNELEKELGEVLEKQEEISHSLQELQHRLQTAPVKIVMPHFDEHRLGNKDWYSEGFYTHPHGYKMCLCVNANGSQKGEGTHVSIFIYLMCGEYDNNLKWPFRGSVTVQLLNQREDSQHCNITVSFDHDTPRVVAAQVTNGELANSAFGHDTFIAHRRLGYNRGANRQYLMNDCLYFLVTADLPLLQS